AEWLCGCLPLPPPCAASHERRRTGNAAAVGPGCQTSAIALWRLPHPLSTLVRSWAVALPPSSRRFPPAHSVEATQPGIGAHPDPRPAYLAWVGGLHDALAPRWRRAASASLARSPHR